MQLDHIVEPTVFNGSEILIYQFRFAHSNEFNYTVDMI